jgi:hypothetical protein
MKVKYFRTERGARNHANRVEGMWRNLITRIRCEIGPDFRDRYFVEVRHPSKYGEWIRCGGFSRRAQPAAIDAI